MAAEPAVMPVTTPVDDTVALDELLLHEPPGVTSDSVMVEPAHTFDEPEIDAIVGRALIVMFVVTKSVQPETLVTV